MNESISKSTLNKLYLRESKSAAEIAKILNYSQSKINYWLHRYGIPKRSISEAVYRKCNPNGDPFLMKTPQTKQDWFLWGLGLGLYWGEGTKRNKFEVRLGNADPALVKQFIYFLEKAYSIERSRLRFGLHIFPDIALEKTISFWTRTLSVSRSQFYRAVVKKPSITGTYLKKAPYGVITLYFSNKKLRDLIVGEIEKLRQLE